MAYNHKDFLSQFKPVHKNYLHSSMDMAPDGLRTAICGPQVPFTEIHRVWKYVTCKDCLNFNRRNINDVNDNDISTGQLCGNSVLQE